MNHALPVAIPAAISVLPTPVENAPRAPYVQVWESADDHIASYRQAFLRKKGMLDSHLSYIKIIGNIVTTGTIRDTFAVFCRLDIFIWNKMIHNKCNFYLYQIQYLRSSYPSHGLQIGEVISFPRTRSSCASISCPASTIQARMSRQNLLSHCHSIFIFLPVIV